MRRVFHIVAAFSVLMGMAAAAPQVAAQEDDAGAEARLDIERRTKIPYPTDTGTRRPPMAVEPLEAPEQAEARRRLVDCGHHNSGAGWLVVAGEGLRQTLQSWAQCAGWRVQWNTDYRFTLMADAHISGDFVEATSRVISSFSHSDPPVFGRFYRSNQVLVVSTPAQLSNR